MSSKRRRKGGPLKPHPPTLRAKIVERLRRGEAVSALAREFKTPWQTIATWKARDAGGKLPTEAASGKLLRPKSPVPVTFRCPHCSGPLNLEDF